MHDTPLMQKLDVGEERAEPRFGVVLGDFDRD